MELSEIIDQLKSEQPPKMFNGRPKGQICKYCNTALAVCCEESTIVHERNWTHETVSVKTLYHGKYVCQMCHRYQA